MIRINLRWILFTGYLLLALACESEKRIPPRGYIPSEPVLTENLEAAYFWIPQDKINSPYWKEATYTTAVLTNASTGNLYEDGYLNATGTYLGTDDFNQGRDPELKVKAGYDDNYLYIMLEWKDTTVDASHMTRLFQGPSDPLKTDTAGGWTSQRNQDNIVLLFDMNNGDSKDAWKWSVATTAPFDRAANLTADAQGELTGNVPGITRNGPTDSSRMAPDYEWNGRRQEITLPDGTTKLLDPAYYLLDDFKMPVPGDIQSGQTVFNHTADCRFCHGPDGNGVADEFTSGGALNRVFTNRFSRGGLVEFIGSSGHEGGGTKYFGKIENDPEVVGDLLTFLRGIAGQPGYSLALPQEEAEIVALTNVGLGSINTANSSYKVLLRRKLQNGKTEDIQFDPDQTYTFSIRLSDNDEINYVEANDIRLIFKSNEL